MCKYGFAFLLFLYAGCNACCFGQPKPSGFSHIPFIPGLPQHTVQALCEDNRNFLWIGTESGLCRYDGKNIETYKAGDNPSFHLLDATINSIAKDTGNRLWVATTEGVSIFHPEKNFAENKASTLLADAINKTTGEIIVDGFCPTASGAVYICYNKGIGFYNGYNHHFTYYTTLQINGARQVATVTGVVEKPDGNLLLLVQGTGLVEGNFQKGFSTFLPGTATGFAPAYAFWYAAGKIWMATYAGLFRCSTTGNSPPERVAAIPPEMQINCLAYDAQRQRLLVGTNTNGLFVLSENGLLIDQVKSRPYNSLLPSNEVYSILPTITRNGYWVGTSMGLAKMFYSENRFESEATFDSAGGPLKIYPLYTADNRNLYVGTLSGMFRYYLPTRQKTAIAASGSREQPRFYSLAPFATGLLAGTNNGLYVLKNKMETSLLAAAGLYPELKALEGNRIYYLCPFEGNNWMMVYRNGNSNGLVHWNPQQHLLSWYRPDGQQADASLNKMSEVRYLGNRRFVVSTNLGPLLFSPANEQFTHIPATDPNSSVLRTNQINTTVFHQQQFWAGTYGAGLVSVQAASGRTAQFVEKNGLCNNEIYAIVPASDSILWVSTNNGLSRFNTLTRQFQNYIRPQQLLANEYNRNSSFRCGDTIYFGGLSGFVWFNHKDFDQKEMLPPVYADKAGYVDQDGEHLFEAESSENLVAGSGQNTIVFTLSCPYYTNPEEIQFYYRLLPGSETWISNGTGTRLLLTNLPPGRFTLELKAGHQQGMWSVQNTLVHITVRPRWYQTIWFRVLVAGLLLAAGYGFYHIRLSQKRKIKRTREQIAADLHDDLGGTLNSIKLYSHLVQQSGNADPLLQQITESSAEAITGLKDLIWTLDDHNDTVGDLVEKIVQFAEPLLAGKGIAFQYHCPAGLKTHPLGKEEKRNLYLILKEAITNCVRHAQATEVSLIFGGKNGKLQISFTDNGRGLAQNDTKAVGHGIKNMKLRAAQINYKCTVVAAPTGKGTVILLTE